jgi:hypothetical protein
MSGMSQEEIEALMNGVGGFDESPKEEKEPPKPEENLDSTTDLAEETETEVENSDTNDIDVSSIIGVEDILGDVVSDDDKDETSSASNSEDLSNKIDEGVFPLPVEKNHKVVNQLTEVANDSEEKVAQIFDVLSFVLDENDVIADKNKQMQEFIEKQLELLTTLHGKFPNVAQFKDNLDMANSVANIPSEISGEIEQENMKLLEAMELMQFNDINRQKIERVMMVIKKLATYLNNLFEDEDGMVDNLSIAKHLDGDSNNDLVGDDLDDLIAEFNK